MLRSKLHQIFRVAFAKALPLCFAVTVAAACAQTRAPLETSSLTPSDPAMTALSAGPVTSQDLAPVATAPEGQGNAPSGASKAGDSKAADVIEQARHLRLGGEKVKALALLDGADGADKDPALMKERGLLSLELGKVKQAESLLSKVVDKGDTDWRSYSALGAALSAQGKQPAAQEKFARALEIVPDHPSVLNNLALSFALEGQHDKAEALLRQASRKGSKDKKAEQNLALILGLNGKIDDAKAVSEKVLPAGKAKANVAYFTGRKRSQERVARADPASVDTVQAASLTGAKPAGQSVVSLGAPEN